jgi:hypothetical protein
MNKITQVTATALAQHLGHCTRETVADYLATGVIRKLPNGKFDQDACRDRVFAHLRDRAAGRTGDLSKERAAQAREMTEAIKLKNAVMRGDYVSLEGVAKQVDAMMLVLRARALAMPGTVGDRLATALGIDRTIVVNILTEAVNEMLEQMANPARGA